MSAFPCGNLFALPWLLAWQSGRILHYGACWVRKPQAGSASSVPSGMAARMATLMDAAERMGLDIVGQSQEMSSGQTLKRMGLREALRALRLGYANAVITYNVLQLSVDKLVLLQVLEIIQNNHAVLICTAEDACTHLHEMGLSQELYQRAFSLELDLPWLSDNKSMEKNGNDSK